ncbi:MAG TPA: acetate/propionate family kinase [Solirubrobacterales bacterium]|nr:acetate/propionate family kinase [Solirubrobacterales bacterium]
MPERPGPVLAVNVGSSSLKLSVLGEDDAVLAADERDYGGEEAELAGAFEGFLAGAPEPAAAGHRVVHGGDSFTGAAIVDEGVEAAIDALAELAPLHNPRALAAIRTLGRLRPGLPAVACFDTSFHATIPAEATTYALPAGWTGPPALRRYGFHGLSHAYASRRAAQLLGREVAELRLVTAHLGAGASLAAVGGGRSLDTTMGFTPLEGLVMATRAGSVDPGLLLWLQRRRGLDTATMERELDREAGLLGLSGTSDMREVLAGAEAGKDRCRLALDVYLHRLAAGVAAMAAALGGIDALVFTGGVGEHAPRVRAECCRRLAFLGLALDGVANESAESDAVISPPGAAAATLVVSAREDLEIARQTREALRSYL